MYYVPCYVDPTSASIKDVTYTNRPSSHIILIAATTLALVTTALVTSNPHGTNITLQTKPIGLTSHISSSSSLRPPMPTSFNRAHNLHLSTRNTPPPTSIISAEAHNHFATLSATGATRFTLFHFFSAGIVSALFSVLCIMTRWVPRMRDSLLPPLVMCTAMAEGKSADSVTQPHPPIRWNGPLFRGRPLPLDLVVGHEDAKTALLMTAVNPAMGGIVISGGHGTAKSVMAKALQRVMPPIQRVIGSPFNTDPQQPDEVDDLTLLLLEKEGKALADLEVETIPCPFVQVPLNVTEDRLLGSVDVEESIKQGKTVFSPGILAGCHRGILYIDDLHLLDRDICAMLMSAVSDGWVRVEREGISVKYPCRPILVATYNPLEGTVRDHILDHFAIALDLDEDPLSLTERVAAVHNVDHWLEMTRDNVEEFHLREGSLTTQIMQAREYLLQNATLTRNQLKFLCEESTRAGCEGQRAEIFASQVAKTSAALEQRPVNAEDLKLAVKLVILPRSSFVQTGEEPAAPPPPQPEMPQDTQDDSQDTEQPEESSDQMEVPEEFMFEPITGIPLDPSLLKAASRAKRGKAGGRGMVYNEDRGRYVKSAFPKAKVKHLAIDATLRAAAPYQLGRRKRAEQRGDTRKVLVEEPDLRIKRMARRAGCLIIFAVDASGSMAMNRMDAAKGAAITLLQAAYRSRDKVCLVAFQGDHAQVLVPPTKSITLIRSRLEDMPCGGGSPLAHAINTSVKVAASGIATGDAGQAILVLVTDGRANVPLSKATGEDTGVKYTADDVRAEAVDIAKRVRSVKGLNVLVLDSEDKFLSNGLTRELADAMGATYQYLPHVSSKSLASATAMAVDSLRG